MKRIILYLFFVLTVFCLCSCKNNGSTYFVDFITNCEVEIDEVVIKGNNEILELPKIDRVGYNFMGWYTDGGFTNEVKEGTLIKDDLTLYAKWERDYTQKLVHVNGTTLYIDEFGDLYTWGGQFFSELFFGRTKITNEPTHVLNGMKFKHVAVTDNGGYLLLIDLDGNLYHYEKKSLGNTFHTSTDSLELFSTNIKFKFASVSQTHVLAVSVDDNLYGWGENSFDCIGGKESFYEEPYQLTTTSNVLTCATTDGANSAYVSKDGSLYTWGFVSECVGHPEIKRGTITSIPSPRKVQGLENIVDVSMTYCTHAIDIDGNVYGFGRNLNGRIGIGDLRPHEEVGILTPTKLDSFDEAIGKVCNYGGTTFFITEQGKLYVTGDVSISRLNEYYGLDVDDDVSYYPYEVDFPFGVKNIFLYNQYLSIVDMENSVYTAGYIELIGNGEFTKFYTPYKLKSDNIRIKQVAYCRGDIYGIDENNILYQYEENKWTKVMENIEYIVDSSLEKPYNGACFFAIDTEGYLYVKGNLPISAFETKSYDEFTLIYPEYTFKSIEGWFAITSDGDVFDVVGGEKINEIKNIKMYVRGTNGSLAVDEEGSLWGRGNNTYGELFTGDTEKVTKFKKIDFNEKVKKIGCTTYYFEILTEEGNLYHCGKETNGVITLIDTNVIDSYRGNIYIKEDGLYTAYGSYYKADPEHYVDLGKSKVFFDENVKSIYAKNEFTIIVTNSFEIYVWGNINKNIFINEFDSFSREINLIKQGGK